MIQCGECGREVSDRAPTCPQCGAPVVGAAAPAVAVSPIASPPSPPTRAGHRCIHCGSGDLTFSDEKQGFGIGKAFAGAVVLGPLGLLAGGINRKKSTVMVRCGACLKQFSGDEMIANAVVPPGTHDPKAIYKCPKCGASSRKFTQTCRACGAKIPVSYGPLIFLVAVACFVLWRFMR